MVFVIVVAVFEILNNLDIPRVYLTVFERPTVVQRSFNSGTACGLRRAFRVHVIYIPSVTAVLIVVPDCTGPHKMARRQGELFNVLDPSLNTGQVMGCRGAYSIS
ncbi:hypothetical protein D3C80_1335410 [compost metagenome]